MEKNEKTECKVIDGTDAILGRIASESAKRLLGGEKIKIVNVEKIIITGRPETTYKKYKARRERGTPQRGPFFPRTPDGMVRRAIRGMMPYKKSGGMNALKNLDVCVGPAAAPTEEKKTKNIISDSITVGELAKKLGWKG